MQSLLSRKHGYKWSKKCSKCGYEAEYGDRYERCPKCYQIYEILDACTLYNVFLGCMLNKMRMNDNKWRDIENNK